MTRPDFYTDPQGNVATAREYVMDRYRAAMLKAFNARQVTLPQPPFGWTPESGAPAQVAL
jgi:hypothetical protein